MRSTGNNDAVLLAGAAVEFGCELQAKDSQANPCCSEWDSALIITNSALSASTAILFLTVSKLVPKALEIISWVLGNATLYTVLLFVAALKVLPCTSTCIPAPGAFLGPALLPLP